MLSRDAAVALLILCLGALQAAAQQAPGQPYPLFTKPPTRADSARAIHELFRSRRGGGSAWLAFGTAGILGATLPAQQTTSAGVWTPGVVAGTSFVLIGLNKRIQFRASRERRVLADYAATGRLPASVKRRLRGNFRPLPGTATTAELAFRLPAATPAPQPVAAPTPAVSPAIADSAQRLPAAPAPRAATPVAAAPPAVRPPTDAQIDSLDAVQGMFQRQRFNGTLPALVVLPLARLLTGSSATQASNSSSPYGPQPQKASDGSVALGLLLAGGGLAYLLIHNAPYTKARYAALQASYLAGQPLPHKFVGQLKEKDQEKGRQYRERQERRHRH